MAIRKYLFVDDDGIDSTYALHREIPPPERHPDNPLLVADQPWEEGVKCYGTVSWEQGRFRFWYQMLALRHACSAEHATGVGYAESLDGFSWSKPLLGLEHPLHGPTNLLMLSAGRAHLCSPSVVRDECDPDARRRYKMLFYDAMTEQDLERLGCPFPPDATVPGWRAVDGEGMFLATSADGILWRRPALPCFSGPSDVAAMSQAGDGRLLATFKTSVRDDRHFRVIAQSESMDGERWSAPIVVLEPDWRDAHGTEFYGMSSFEYFGQWLGLICVYHNAPDDKHLDIQLASSPDGRSWSRAGDRRVWLPVGPRGAWDAGGLYVASVPLIAPPSDPERIWLYYSAISARHDDFRYKEWSIGLARLRLDGFGCLVAGYFPGELRTRPLRATADRMMLNIECLHGHARIWIRDAARGDLLAASRPIEGVDAVALMVDWDGEVALNGREVVVEIHLRRARLYAYWFE